MDKIGQEQEAPRTHAHYIGKCVYLNGQKVPMTITCLRITPLGAMPQYDCMWFDRDLHLQTAIFNEATLTTFFPKD